MLRMIVAVLLSLSTLTLFTLRTASPRAHIHPVTQEGTPMIDGAVHPELIPDLLAYRLYFSSISVSGDALQADRIRQQSQLSQTGLRNDDQEIIRSVVADFRSSYEAAITQYNQKASSVSGFNQASEIADLLKNLDDLVQSTRKSLTARLTPQGVAQLHAIVMAEKKNMQMQPEDK